MTDTERIWYCVNGHGHVLPDDRPKLRQFTLKCLVCHEVASFDAMWRCRCGAMSPRARDCRGCGTSPTPETPVEKVPEQPESEQPEPVTWNCVCGFINTVDPLANPAVARRCTDCHAPYPEKKDLTVRSISAEEIANRVRYHAPTTVGVVTHGELADRFEDLMNAVNRLLPNGREKSETFTLLETAKMWASAGVARNPETR